MLTKRARCVKNWSTLNAAIQTFAAHRIFYLTRDCMFVTVDSQWKFYFTGTSAYLIRHIAVCIHVACAVVKPLAFVLVIGIFQVGVFVCRPNFYYWFEYLALDSWIIDECSSRKALEGNGHLFMIHCHCTVRCEVTRRAWIVGCSWRYINQRAFT